MPHNVASDQGLQCLPTGFSIKKKNKSDKKDPTPLEQWKTLPVYNGIKCQKRKQLHLQTARLVPDEAAHYELPHLDLHYLPVSP